MITFKSHVKAAIELITAGELTRAGIRRCDAATLSPQYRNSAVSPISTLDFGMDFLYLNGQSIWKLTPMLVVLK